MSESTRERRMLTMKVKEVTDSVISLVWSVRVVTQPSL